MKKEARLLLQKSLNSLLLAVEHFNRPMDRGRTEAVLIFLNHSFEMLLKAIIVHKGGRITERRAAQTVGFERCLGKCLSDEATKALNEDQARTLRAVNGLRDAAEHYLLDMPEELLYIHAQASVSIFRDLLGGVLGRNLTDFLPDRVLPVSTRPPRDMPVILADELAYVRALLQPGRRNRTTAMSHLRGLTIIENAVGGDPLQPADQELRRKLRRLTQGEDWQTIFPNVACLEVRAEGAGPCLSVRITRREGTPVRLVPEGEPSAAVVAVRRVNELDYYSLGFRDLLGHLRRQYASIGQNDLHALIEHLGIRQDPDCFKQFTIGSATFKRYSPRALERLRAEIPRVNLPQVTTEYAQRRRARGLRL